MARGEFRSRGARDDSRKVAEESERGGEKG